LTSERSVQIANGESWCSGNRVLVVPKPALSTVEPTIRRRRDMFERVLVGTDGSATATRAVEAAALVARAHGSVLIVGHAFSSRQTWGQQRAWAEAPEESRWRLSVGAVAEATVHAAIDRAHETVGAGLKVLGRCEPGRPVPVLLAMVDALDVDALVIGNRDMRARLRLGRSVGRRLARRAACDVVIVDTVGRRQGRVTAHRGTAFRWV
jgi:nucleotide-binding universal stress UspA family protein